MRASFVTPDDTSWASALDRFEHDAYHLPSYVAHSARYDGGEAGAVLVENDGPVLLLPLVLRCLPENLGAPSEWRDAVSPYGYASPLLAGGVSVGEAQDALAASLHLLVQLNVVTVFARLHPLLIFPREALQQQGEVVDHGRTVAIPLDRSEDELWLGMRKNLRRDIRMLERQGFHTVLDDWEQLETFTYLYKTTMDRVGAGDYYYFDRSYFLTLREALGSRVMLASVRAANGDVAAAGLFTHHQGLIGYHLGATSDRYLKPAPTKRMLCDVMRWGSANGDHWLHLGGGVGSREDSLFRFKHRFSESTRIFATARFVTHPQRYRWLNEQRREASSDLPDAGFFPSYRSPPGATTERATHED